MDRTEADGRTTSSSTILPNETVVRVEGGNKPNPIDALEKFSAKKN